MINSLGIATPEFKETAKAKLNEWFGGEDQYEILFQWFDNNVTYVCVRYNLRAAGDKELCFFRLFTIGNKMVISQDRKMEI